jgi:hypothetical protein
MAEHSMIVEQATPDDFSMEDHRQTYRGMIAMFTWGSVAIAIVMIFLMWVWYG